MPRIDLTSRTFGRLTVESLGDYDARLKRRSWWCVCACGRRLQVPAGSLTTGNTRSCGCLKSDLFAATRLRRTAVDPIERFWSKVRPNHATGCLEYDGTPNAKGYMAYGADHAQEAAHRYAWMTAYGPIPKGLMVLHSCDNPPCVNPAHLFLGTNRDNMRDMVQKDRAARADRNPNVKLTWDEVQQLRADSETCSVRELARRYGVHHSTAWGVARGKWWTRPPKTGAEA